MRTNDRKWPNFNAFRWFLVPFINDPIGRAILFFLERSFQCVPKIDIWTEFQSRQYPPQNLHFPVIDALRIIPVLFAISGVWMFKRLFENCRFSNFRDVYKTVVNETYSTLVYCIVHLKWIKVPKWRFIWPVNLYSQNAMVPYSMKSSIKVERFLHSP